MPPDEDPDRDAWQSIRDEIGHSQRLHVSPGKPSIAVTLTLTHARACDGDRVDSGPRDQRLAIGFDTHDAATSPAL